MIAFNLQKADIMKFIRVALVVATISLLWSIAAIVGLLTLAAIPLSVILYFDLEFSGGLLVTVTWAIIVGSVGGVLEAAYDAKDNIKFSEDSMSTYTGGDDVA